MMDREVIHRVVLARHLYELATSSVRSKNDLHLFSAANLAQDAVETLLIAAANHVGAHFDQNTKFDKYFVLIEEQTPHRLPRKHDMLRLNRVRNESKHHGIQPERGNCERLVTSAGLFLEETAQLIFGSPFATISAIQLLTEGASKQSLLRAENALKNQNFWDCLVLCRQALFLEIECRYDIRPFANGLEGIPMGFRAFLSRAPYFARSKEYIDENVLDPTDYIVLDYAQVDADLLTSGADPTAFANVRRLSPEVYHTREQGDEWIIKGELDLLSGPSLKVNAEYVLSATTDILLALHQTRNVQRSPSRRQHFIAVVTPSAPIYAKADKNSEVVARIPEGMTKINTSAFVEGLRRDGKYWRTYDHRLGIRSGFIHSDDVRESDCLEQDGDG